MELGHIWRHTVLSLETFPTASFTCICLRSAGPSECDSGMSPREKGPAWHSLPILSLSLFFLTTVWFIYFWLGLVFITSQGLSLGIAGRGCSLVVVWRLLIWWLLWRMGSRACRLQQLQPSGLVVAAHGTCYPAARGVFPDGGSNPCTLRWQANS